MVCSLTYVGILAYTPYNYNNPYSNLGTQIIDFSKPLQDFADTITNIGNAGYNSLALAGIVPLATQLYILTFDVTYTDFDSNQVTTNAYLLVYASTTGGSNQFNYSDLHRIYAFRDGQLNDGSYLNRMNFYIKDQRCEYFQHITQSNTIQHHEYLVRMNQDYSKYGMNVISVSSQDLIFNITREDLNFADLTYNLVDAKPFDMSQMYAFNFTYLY